MGDFEKSGKDGKNRKQIVVRCAPILLSGFLSVCVLLVNGRRLS